MPPWNRLRSERPSEKDLRRRTVFENVPPDIDSSKSTQREEAPFTSPPSTPQRRVRRTRDSVVSLSAVHDPPSIFEPSLPVLEVPEAREKAPKQHRFSLLKFRHASDSQLSKTAKEHAETIPPLPSRSKTSGSLFILIVTAVQPPSIITTAPTSENLEVQKRKPTFSLARRHKTPNGKKSSGSLELSGNSQTESTTPSRATFDEPSRLRGNASVPAPPPYGDLSNSALALPITRLSESSRSDESSGDHGIFATTTTTHTVSTTTTFFRLPRRKKDRGPLFPLPPRVTTERNSESPTRQFMSAPPGAYGSPRKSGQHSPSHAALASSSIAFATSGTHLPRSNSRASTRSAKSAGRPSNLERRGRSSTMSSLRRAVEDDNMPTPPLPQSTRTSTSTAGRPSLGTLFNLNRLRQSSEPLFRSGLGSGTPGTPGSIESKKPSFNIPREPAIVVPERQEGDTPAKYLARLEEVVDRGALLALLSKSDDEFTKNVMRSYMRSFKLFEDPLDMAVRKMLMQVDLPKETQQIDRTLQSFADRYHECNPGIFASPGMFNITSVHGRDSDECR